MTKTEFLNICVELYLDPNIALENEELCELLKERAELDTIRAFMLANF